MARTAVQLYTLRDIDEPLPALLDRVGGTSFEGVEFAHRVGEADPGTVADALTRNDLSPAVAHVGLAALEESYDETTARYRTLGVETLVVPWLDPEHFESGAAVADAAERLNAVASDLAADGFALAYHNHDQEFADLDGRPALEELLARTDDRVGLELDLGWAAVGGVDPAAYLERHADRITHVHFSDADAASGTPVELGEGAIDLDACAAAAREAGAEWFVYENDDPSDAAASLTHGAATLDRLR
ncbi:sugar phosphate isomerase/epimerase [Haloparvum alkalitolerans]|uniref:sugar phosphate isomerase/epimerase family protein n=1 Tax=Haloparvum alkalitolerans TaxID=1042953 RepID=UPI003CF66FBE